MKKELKDTIIVELGEKLKEYAHFYLVDLTGLNAEKTSNLRRQCFKNDIKLLVVKNTLLHKAFEAAEIDYSPERKINGRVIEQLSTGAYIDKARNVVIVGACGTGKSYIANALASDACRKLHRTMYCRMFELISDIKHMEM